MRAMVAVPGDPGSARLVEDWPEPQPGPYDVLVRSVLIGLCGSDRELLARPVRGAPLVVGHESLGLVVSAPHGSGFDEGDLVFGTIRRACAARCFACLFGRFDECEAQPPVERGLFDRDGFGCDYWLSLPRHLVRVDPRLEHRGVLAEPLTCLVKLRRRLSERPVIGSRVLIAGAGTIGLLAAWLWAREGAEVHLVDRFESRQAREFVALLPGATLQTSWPDAQFELAIDATGSVDAISACVDRVRHGGLVALVGIAPVAADVPDLVRRVVMRDLTLVGSVNATAADHRTAARLLASAPLELLDALIGLQIGPDDWPAWSRGEIASPGGKVVVRFSDAAAGVTRIRDEVATIATTDRGEV